MIALVSSGPASTSRKEAAYTGRNPDFTRSYPVPLPDAGEGSIYRGAKTLDERIALTKDKDARVREAAVRALADMPSEATTTVPVLIELLKDENDRVRWVTVCTLEALGRDSKDAALPLAKLLNDKNENVRHGACQALMMIGPEAKAAVPSLIELLNDNDVDVRHCACDALMMIGPEARAAVPALTRSLKDENGFCSESGSFGPWGDSTQRGDRRSRRGRIAKGYGPRYAVRRS